ncbi:MAG: EamA family transporter [Candidatus Eisenbacteria bacterium]|uniref:EamA family transporter n=1 Tax=Eiseniibacteriota bacterium TaxID=2212470 RepID=A0A849SG83_UNCEI|nr:EamA family transporter [Candidatus Eisenbacteria bacterium]
MSRVPGEPLATAAAAAATRRAGNGRWLVAGAATLWGTTATLARFVFHDRSVSPFVVVELRLAIAVAVLGLWLAIRDPSAFRVSASALLELVVLGAVGVTLVQVSYYYSIAHLGVGLAILLQYLAPSLIVALHLIRRQPTRRETALAVLMAASGTALLVSRVPREAADATPLQWAVSFASAAFFAGYILLSKRILKTHRPETTLFYSFSTAAVVLAIVAPPWRIAAAGYGADLWLMFVALGLLSTLAPFVLFNFGLQRMPAAEAGIVATLEPVVAVISAWVFLGERLESLQWAGAALVLSAAVLASGAETPTAKRIPATPRQSKLS